MIADLQPLLDGWRRAARPDLVRLALVDVDGCLTAGEAAPLDFDLLARLKALNRRAVEDPAVPGLALCTGRPEPYVELLTQGLGGYLPAIWENGAGLYLPTEYRFLLHPLLDATRLAAFEQARRLVRDHLLQPGLAVRQPGKEVSISLYPTQGRSVDELWRVASEALSPVAESYWVQAGLTCVEVLPVGIDKGAGVRWALDHLGLRPAQVLGIGDAPGDVEIFRAVGLGACPANGSPVARAAAHYVARASSTAGVLEILDWAVDRNRAALAAR
jgi:HAD superfamily hydrolase (TIGR01484 family)